MITKETKEIYDENEEQYVGRAREVKCGLTMGAKSGRAEQTEGEERSEARRRGNIERKVRNKDVT